MKLRPPSSLPRCLLEPFTDARIATTLVTFWLLFLLADLVHRVLSMANGILALLGLAAVAWFSVPALLAWLLQLIEARALSTETPLLTVNHFNLTDRVWRLALIVYVALFVALQIELSRHWPAATPWLPALTGSLLLPLMLIELAVTHAPLQGLNPVTLWRLAMRLGAGYLPVPVVLCGGLLVIPALLPSGTPTAVLAALALYGFALFAVLSGTVATRLDVRAEIDLPPPLLPADADSDARTVKRRTQALNHAYGMISRGNRDGGCKHLATSVAAEADPLTAERWFFTAMLNWDSTDAALYYAQQLLHKLLDAGDERGAMKLLLRCLHENAAFRPLPGDRERLIGIADSYGQQELSQALQ